MLELELRSPEQSSISQAKRALRCGVPLASPPIATEGVTGKSLISTALKIVRTLFLGPHVA